MVFEIGAKVIYPSHGVAEIVGRESRAISGATETYLVLSVLQPGWGTRGRMKVSLPEDRAEALGVRAAISREDASDVIELLGMSDVHVPGNWSRRFKNHQEKLRSGDVYACAEVVRNLALRQRKTSLAAAETAMYTARPPRLDLGARGLMGNRRRRGRGPCRWRAGTARR